MVIDISKFFDFEVADIHYGFNKEIYYDVVLVSKSTGEVIIFTFNNELFDDLLAQMEENVKFLEDKLTFVREQKWWFYE